MDLLDDLGGLQELLPDWEAGWSSDTETSDDLVLRAGERVAGGGCGPVGVAPCGGRGRPRAEVLEKMSPGGAAEAAAAWAAAACACCWALKAAAAAAKACIWEDML